MSRCNRRVYMLTWVAVLLSGCTVKDFGVYAGKSPIPQVNVQFPNTTGAGVDPIVGGNSDGSDASLVSSTSELISGTNYGFWLSFKPDEKPQPIVINNTSPPAVVATSSRGLSESDQLARNLYTSCIDAMAKGDVVVALSDCKVAAQLNPKYNNAFDHALAMRERPKRDLANIQQFREQIIRPALKRLGAYDRDAEELILATIIHESLAGAYLKQIKGPALGYCQMEPATHNDIWKNFLSRADKRKYRETFSGKVEASRLATDTFYAVQMCRLHYLRVAEKLPKRDDIESIARYWKKYFNTHKGKGRVEDFIRHYKEYVK